MNADVIAQPSAIVEAAKISELPDGWVTRNDEELDAAGPVAEEAMTM